MPRVKIDKKGSWKLVCENLVVTLLAFFVYLSYFQYMLNGLLHYKHPVGV